MKQAVYCSVSYLVDFIKLFGAVFFIFDLKMKDKRNTLIFSAAAFVLVSIASYRFDLTKNTIIYSIVAICTVALCLKNKKQVWNVIAVMLIINFIDTIIALTAIALLKLNYEQLSGCSYTALLLNSISDIMIFTIIILKKNRLVNVSAKAEFNFKDILIFGSGILSIAIYLSSIMLFMMNSSYNSYRSIAAIALSAGGIIFMIICVSLLSARNKNIHLKTENDITCELLSQQEQYYSMLLKREEETKKFRHDIRNHMYCLRTLYKNKDYTELDKYFDKLQIELDDLSIAVNTGNKLIDCILNDIQSKHSDVKVDWTGMLGADIKIENIDLCTIFSNLLSNAFESAGSSKDKFVSVSVKFLGTSLFVHIENSCDKEPLIENGHLLTTKNEKGHGYGVKNIISHLGRYNGNLEYDYNYNDRIFTAEIIIPDAVRI